MNESPRNETFVAGFLAEHWRLGLFPLGVNHLFNIGNLPVSMGIEASYSVIHPDDLPASRWDIRFTLMPLLPTPWSRLAKELKALE